MRFLPIIIWLHKSNLSSRHYNSPFYRWGKWRSETSRSTPKFPQVESIRARTQIQSCLSPKGRVSWLCTCPHQWCLQLKSCSGWFTPEIHSQYSPSRPYFSLSTKHNSSDKSFSSRQMLSYLGNSKKGNQNRICHCLTWTWGNDWTEWISAIQILLWVGFVFLSSVKWQSREWYCELYPDSLMLSHLFRI